MNAVLPEWASPVTASRTVRSRKSSVSVGSLAIRIGRIQRQVPSAPVLSGWLHRHVEHDVGQDLPDHAPQRRLVCCDRGGQQTA